MGAGNLTRGDRRSLVDSQAVLLDLIRRDIALKAALACVAGSRQLSSTEPTGLIAGGGSHLMPKLMLSWPKSAFRLMLSRRLWATLEPTGREERR